MVYKKLIVVLVILLALYGIFQFNPFEYSIDQHRQEGENKSLKFPDEVGSFSVSYTKERLSSEGNSVILSCPSPSKNFEPDISYKLNYENGMRDLDVFVHKDKNKTKIEDCFQSNLNFFSEKEDLIFREVELESKTGFFVEGKLGNYYSRIFMMVDDDSNFIVVSKSASSLEELPSEEDLMKVASSFEVKQR